MDFNRQRPAPTRRDLALAIEALLTGGAVEASMTVAAGTGVKVLGQLGVGCFVSDLK